MPPSSASDGIYLRTYVTSPQEAGWSSSALANYRMADGNAFATPSDGAWDRFGQKWTSQAPDRSTVATSGGTLRGILLGSSPAFEAMGYSYTGAPGDADSFSLSYSDNSSLHAFGDRAELPLSPGDATAFDFWVCTPFGVYTVFAPGNSSSVSGVNAQVLWTEAPLLVSTFIPALNNTALVETWIVSVIEQGGPADARSEFRFALQQFPVTGHTHGDIPVPEPSSYVLLGTALCGILIVRRMVRRGKQT